MHRELCTRMKKYFMYGSYTIAKLKKCMSGTVNMKLYVS